MELDSYHLDGFCSVCPDGVIGGGTVISVLLPLMSVALGAASTAVVDGSAELTAVVGGSR